MVCFSLQGLAAGYGRKGCRGARFTKRKRVGLAVVVVVVLVIVVVVVLAAAVVLVMVVVVMGIVVVQDALGSCSTHV